MYLIKQTIISLVIASMMFMSSIAHAELKYQQDFTQTNWVSQESLEEEVRDFCKAAEGDPNIKVLDIKYTQVKESKNSIRYNAIITCYVSEVDKDLMRISGKVFQQKHGLISKKDVVK